MATKKQASKPESRSNDFAIFPARMSGGLVTSDDVPDEFKGAESTSSLPPTPQWDNPGDYVIGTYLGTKTKVGKNKQELHQFATEKGTDTADFAVWGSTVINNFIHEQKVAVGDRMMITYLGTAPVKGRKQEVKKFDIKLVRSTAAKSSKRK